MPFLQWTLPRRHGVQSPSSAWVLAFAVLCSALWVATLPPRLVDAVPLLYVLSQIRYTSTVEGQLADMTAGVVEFAAGYDKVDDISGSTHLFPINDGWTNALAGYKTNNRSATPASDPVFEALDTIVKSPGSVSALNAMSANAKNALSRLAKFMAIRGTILTTDMASGNYKTGRFSFDTEVNQPIYLYANVTGALVYASLNGLDHAFTGTDRGSVDPTTYPTNGLIAGNGAGGPKAVAVVIYGLSLTQNTTTTLGKTVSSSDMTAIFVSDLVFPSNMGSLTSYDPVTKYGKDAGRLALYGNSLALVLSLFVVLVLI